MKLFSSFALRLPVLLCTFALSSSLPSTAASTAVVARAVMADSSGVVTTPLTAITLGGVTVTNWPTGGGSGGGSSMPTQLVSVATPGGGTTGLVFTGTFAPLPNAPATPTPADAASAVAQPVTLSWTDTGTGYAVAATFDVLTNGVPAATRQTATSLLLPDMGSAASVSWQVIAHNASGATTGTVWSFTTGASSQNMTGIPSLTWVISIDNPDDYTGTLTNLLGTATSPFTADSGILMAMRIDWSDEDQLWYLGWGDRYYYNTSPTGTWTSLGTVTYPIYTTAP